MALAVVQTTGLASATAPVAIATPTSVTNGDLLIIALNWDGFPTVSSGPKPGFALLTAAAASDGTGTNVYTNIYWKKASAEPASYSAAFSFAANWSYQFVVIRGQNGSTSAIDSPANVRTGSSSVMDAAALTISHAGSLRLIFNCQNGFSGGPTNFDPPAGYANNGAQVTSTLIACASFNKIIASSGTDAAIAAMTASGGGGVHPWTSITLAIAASAGGAASPILPFIGSLQLLGVGR